MRKGYTLSWDREVKLITICLGTVTILVGLYFLWEVFRCLRGNVGAFPLNIAIMLSFAMFSMTVLTFPFAPLRYVITDKNIIIRRFGPDIKIPLENLADIRTIERKELRKCIRVCGCGGMFGCMGLFYSKTLGFFRASITNSRQLVVIYRTKGRPFLISPDDREGFVENIKNLLSSQ